MADLHCYQSCNVGYFVFMHMALRATSSAHDPSDMQGIPPPPLSPPLLPHNTPNAAGAYPLPSTGH